MSISALRGVDMDKQHISKLGRPSFSISSDDLLYMYQCFGSWQRVADYYGVSIRTIFRRVKDYNLVLTKKYK